jgi:serine protease Do
MVSRQAVRSGRLFVAALALAGGAAAAQAQLRRLSAEELYERVAPSVWMVQTRDTDGKGSIGSAVVIGRGALVTNCHVLDKARTITVRHGSRAHPASLEHRDPVRDLCQLHAPGVSAPSVPVVDWSTLRIGAKLYALGNPRGLELTLSDGLLSGIRRDAADNIEAIQISVPISPGSSGGGLFDVYGQLVGITTSGLRESQNLNFALPATWIAELPRRAGGQLARAEPAPAPAAPAAPPIAPTAPTAPAPPTAVAGAFNVIEYRLRDRLSGVTHPVLYRVDRRDGEQAVLNGGTRIEAGGGRVVALSAAIAGEFEQAMPPGGWVTGDKLRVPAWSSSYETAGDGRPIRMQLSARAQGEELLRFKDRELVTLRVQFKGYTSRGAGATNNPPGAYTAIAWYAPELGRVVRFEARSRGGLGHTAFVVDELLELIDLRSE